MKWSVIPAFCKRAYVFFGVTLLSSVLLFFAANGVSVFILKMIPVVRAVISDTKDDLHAQLVHLSRQELGILKTETWCNSSQYEPWVGSRERTRHGKYVNISADGYRITAGSPQQWKHAIYLFGGSTMFGYNVADSQTIASSLQTKVNALYGEGTFVVRNYGRGYYFSTQELALLVQLLRRSHRPDVAVFFDGLNEGQDAPYLNGMMTRLFDLFNSNYIDATSVKLRRSYLLHAMTMDLPVCRLTEVIGKAMRKPAQCSAPPVTGPVDIKPFRYMVNDYLFSVKTIKNVCAANAVTPYFFIHPIPGYRNDFFNHPLTAANFPELRWDHVQAYQVFADLSKDGTVIDITGLLAGYKKQPFVDTVHFSPEVNQLIAETIFGYIQHDCDRLSGKS